ncbi:MBL fold metallo-hydrolase [Marinospirillum insulare]|uniref:cAMP phosphodiesterase class-II:metallo-beta-lactamase superfamily protein n=1 Tax=Marinospirillum insulare TaxID=217169 RepID=A0ABQ5ZZJ3_9GAMM|nr:3',5'-cyclic-nucleotide phosphodiesterase [Marinospirillum insulare]GLR64096.1 cAMP phosphodiesterase class-II:metallo-beta-lactamase superfamily protein [Marinospirillum insulare]
MKVEILGCSGGMGAGQYTTCYRVNEHILLDAGTGLGQLTHDEQLKIKHIFITHSHMDHICFLPLLIDNLFEHLEEPLEVYALPEVLETLRTHIFNWEIWPDFSTLPNEKTPVVRFNAITPNQPLTLEGLTFTAFLVEHIVPTCGYHLVDQQGESLAFTGDTTFGPEVLKELNRLGKLDVLMTECAFPNRLDELAKLAKHLTPALLSEFIQALEHTPKQVWLSHLKPSQTKEIKAELAQLNLQTKMHLLESGEFLEV